MKEKCFPTLCLVGVNLGRMENIGRKIRQKTVFFTVWQKKENKEEGKPGRKFSLSGPQNSSSQIGRKMLERKVLSQHFYENTPFWNQVKKKNRERALEKKIERMRARATPGTFLNEEDKENKRKEMEIRTTCVRKKKKKKKKNV